MPEAISGAERNLRKVFCSDYEFHIPLYQRPYSWGDDQSRELFSDLFEAFSTNTGPYFLGSVVLIKEDDDAPYAEVIDGQQRLTTITMLLATLANALEGKAGEDTRKYIIEDGDVIAGLEPKPRLFLRESDQSFFHEFIQNQRIDDLFELSDSDLGSEAQKAIKENTKVLVDAVRREFSENIQIQNFASFIVQQCFLIVVSTINRDSAFRVFSVMNNRGLDLQPTDILKANLIGALGDDREQDAYNSKWEDAENNLSREEFLNLFNYIRMIFLKEKPRQSLLKDIDEKVLPPFKGKEPNFIDDIVLKYAGILGVVLQKAHSSENVNRNLKWLHRIDNSDWIPPVMLGVHHFGRDDSKIDEFMKAMERLAAFMHVCRLNINERIAKYSDVMREIESGEFGEVLKCMELDDDQRTAFMKRLDGEVYLNSRTRKFIVLKLDELLSDVQIDYEKQITTIEHVLPQNPKEDGEWMKLWPDEDLRATWTHRIANLALLSKYKQGAASNFPFQQKKEKYFGGATVSNSGITVRVMAETEWTQEVLERRQKEALEVFARHWDLNIPTPDQANSSNA